MVICPARAATVFAPQYGCGRCGFQPAESDGFLAWAPGFADSPDGFHRDDFANLAAIEAERFRFRARSELLLWALREYTPSFRSLLECGCGTGFVLSRIASSLPEARLVGTEAFVEGLAVARGRAPAAELMQMDARALPYADEFDVVAAFDVIEHIDEDELVLRDVHRATRPGGHCLLSVPQHMWLWGPLDEEACHKRRYGAGELEAKAERAGYHVVRSTSFVTEPVDPAGPAFRESSVRWFSSPAPAFCYSPASAPGSVTPGGIGAGGSPSPPRPTNPTASCF